VIRYLLDTNICIELLRGREAGLFKRLSLMSPGEVAISSITLAELQYGVMKSSNPAKHATLLMQFCAPLEIMSFDHATAGVYGRIRATLEHKGIPIGPLDTLIAAHALSLDATLLTNNIREFQRVSGLRVER
jgi:tRNA(fMet)-specific endonuclease VapC